MASVEQGSQGTAEPRKTSTERVRAWVKNNRDRYNANARRYYSEKGGGKARKRRKERYYENIDKERRQAREGMRTLRENRKQQQAGEIFPQTGQ
jgi:hypothetical protein